MRNRKLTKLYNNEQGHRSRLEKEVTELIRRVHKYKKQIDTSKDAVEWRGMYRTQEEQIAKLETEKGDLKMTICLRDHTLGKLNGKVETGDKKVSDLQDQVLYLVTQNLDLRNELVAKEARHRQEDNDTAGYYRAKLGPYENAIEILHQLAERDDEGLLIATFFAQALKIQGLNLHTLGIDEHRADVLFKFVRNGTSTDQTFPPQTFERGFRRKVGSPTPSPLTTLGQAPATAIAPSNSSSQQPADLPYQPHESNQTIRSSLPSSTANNGPQPPFSPEVMQTRKEHTDINHPLYVNLLGDYIGPAEAKKALQKIKTFEKDRKRWLREHDLDPNSLDNGLQPPTGSDFEVNSPQQQTGTSMLSQPSLCNPPPPTQIF